MSKNRLKDTRIKRKYPLTLCLTFIIECIVLAFVADKNGFFDMSVLSKGAS